MTSDDELDAEAEEEVARLLARSALLQRLPALRVRCSLAHDLTTPVAMRLEAAEEAMEMFMDLVMELEQRNRELLIKTYAKRGLDYGLAELAESIKRMRKAARGTSGD